ncbi:DsrE family protein [Novosphingobium terrae]|uniref:DsrE family protein n=1 Tax=Novosphingobium terrae TaxID=2726189 RepID=UPI00197DC41E|nr:DsrE family protein [Novosphingobium terrae]
MRLTLPVLALCLAATPAMAQDLPKFHTGPVFDFGKVADVVSDMPIPRDAHFKVILDTGDAGKPGEINPTINTAARFINMHVAAGVPEANIKVALILHGPAGIDVTKDAFYGAKQGGKPNPNARAVAQLLAHGVDIYLCGQSGTGMGIAKSDMLPGVKMVLSALTARALLQQQGYTVNP